MNIISDPIFFYAAIPAVFLVGLSKGGLGGAFGILGVPLLAFVVPPMQAAAILLPILIAMDIVSLWAWRGFLDKKLLFLMIPGALIGIGIGWLTAAYVSDAFVRLIVGLVALIFALRYFLQSKAKREVAKPHNTPLAWFWSTLAGFTSFVAHAGGPPFQVYALPLKLDPKLLTGTSVILFFIINVVKLVPYYALGQFDASNVNTSVVLFPVAIVSTLIGAAIVKRLKAEIFYPFMYAMVGLVSLKLIYDGIKGLI